MPRNTRGLANVSLSTLIVPGLTGPSGPASAGPQTVVERFERMRGRSLSLLGTSDRCTEPVRRERVAQERDEDQ